MKLNIGAGNTKLEGYTPVDRKSGDEAFPLTINGQKIADNCVSEIRASHILEHFGWKESQLALREWVRVLQGDGKLYISVPDFEKIGLMQDDNRLHYLMGGQTDENDFHKSAWTLETLRAAMINAGLTSIASWPGDRRDTSGHPCSLNLVGTKPKQEKSEEVKITAVMSIPRLGWNDHWGCVTEALRPWNIPIRRYTGAFWGHCLQGVMEICLKDGVDWILSLDYDTVFSQRDLNDLIHHFGINPHIDALASLQRRRNHEFPLCTVKGQRKQETSTGPFACNTAHFGLTLIRVESLKKLPKPWFIGVPGPDGTWTHDDHIDPDIYFWKAWENAGLTCYVDPDVRVGHLELMVTGFDHEMNPETLTVGDWYKKYKHETRQGTI